MHSRRSRSLSPVDRIDGLAVCSIDIGRCSVRDTERHRGLCRCVEDAMYDLRQPHDARDLVVRRRGVEKRAETGAGKETEKEAGRASRVG